jgi:hypothetical protein
MRSKTESDQHVYRVYDKATGEFRLSAIYNPDWGAYVISASKAMKSIHLYNETHIGGLRGNLTGTAFTIFDFGAQNASGCFGFAPPQTELGLVSYGRNLFGWEPREFSIAVPKVERPNEGTETLLDSVDKGNKDDFHFMYNKPPKWNEARNTYTLDFRNKVRKASKKNFILETEVESKEANFFFFSSFFFLSFLKKIKIKIKIKNQHHFLYL